MCVQVFCVSKVGKVVSGGLFDTFLVSETREKVIGGGGLGGFLRREESSRVSV